MHIFPQKVDDFLVVVVVTFKSTLNVQTSKQHVTNLAADRGPLAVGAPFHGTTGTLDNPALAILKQMDTTSSLRRVWFNVDEIWCADGE